MPPLDGPIKPNQLDALNDAILVLQLRGHKELASQLAEVWDKEYTAAAPNAA